MVINTSLSVRNFRLTILGQCGLLASRKHEMEGRTTLTQALSPDRLAVEYEAMYRDSGGNLRFARGLNNPDGQSPTCVFGPGFLEKLQDIPSLKGGLLLQDISDDISRMPLQPGRPGTGYPGA